MAHHVKKLQTEDGFIKIMNKFWILPKRSPLDFWIHLK